MLTLNLEGEKVWIEKAKTEFLDEIPFLSLALQGVENSKEVHEGHVDRSPGEEGKAPREPEEEGYPHHAAYVLQSGAVNTVVRVLLPYPTQLHQHHDEHDKVEKKDDAEVGHHRHVEGNVVPQPAAVGGEGEDKPTLACHDRGSGDFEAEIRCGLTNHQLCHQQTFRRR